MTASKTSTHPPAAAVSTEAQTARCAPVCPLCGGPNACAVSASGRLDTPCWCTQVRIPAAVLARLPAAGCGVACVCAVCAALLE